MPCKSDYMEPSNNEKELSRVLALLEELRTGKLPTGYGTGYGPAYGKGGTQVLDQKTRSLCTKLKNTKDVKKYSLELQIWWRDHQKADELRKKQQKIQVRKKLLAKEALRKLTREEKEALGLL